MPLSRRQVWLISSGATLAVATAVGFVGIHRSTAELEEKRALVLDLVATEKGFIDVPYRLDRTSYETAVANHEAVQARLDALREELHERYVHQEFDGEAMSPLRFMTYTQTQLDVMDQTLSLNGVAAPPQGPAQAFGDYYLQSRVFATPEQISRVQKQLMIHDELVALVGQSGVAQLDHFRYMGDVKSPEAHRTTVARDDLYDSHYYDLTVTGETAALRQFLASLTTSDHCFVVRYLDLRAPAGQTDAVAMGVPQPAPLPAAQPPFADRQIAKADRVIGDTATTVSMSVRVQYVDFL